MKKNFSFPPLDMIYITQRFGENPDMYKKFNMKGHNGIDFRTRFDDSPNARREVFAVDSGVVSQVIKKDNTGYGWHVRINHPDGSQTLYAHLCKIYVSRGDDISAGEAFAITGNTGFSTGPHLHFGYRPPKPDYVNGFYGYIDPIDFFDFDNYFKSINVTCDQSVVKDCKDDKHEEKKNNQTVSNNDVQNYYHDNNKPLKKRRNNKTKLA